MEKAPLFPFRKGHNMDQQFRLSDQRRIRVARHPARKAQTVANNRAIVGRKGARAKKK